MMAPAKPHVPVMLDRVVELLTDAPAGVVVDATLGAAGHAVEVLRARAARHGRAQLVGLDRDPDALALAEANLSDLVDGRGSDAAGIIRADDIDLVQTRFDALPDVLDERGIDRVAGVLLDLGISSMHVDRAERGFSYRQDGPLDMRMGPDAEQTAAELLDTTTTDELVRILRDYGEERHAPRVARAILDAWPMSSTTELAEVVKHAIPAAARRTGGHPATRTFQALRIAVNGELDALRAVLPAVVERLAPGGVAVVLSYHSLEDRIVKRAFVDATRGCICPPQLAVCVCGRLPLAEHIVRKPERPDDTEVAANPRASAARLRALRRVADPARASEGATP